mmetsp:Transcript_40864/g.80532  ORF Transcript_40864/g.80532 Transcript_40864/m.80532 type:complete len:183 (-) Transcript_40864:2865-3413(-)
MHQPGEVNRSPMHLHLLMWSGGAVSFVLYINGQTGMNVVSSQSRKKERKANLEGRQDSTPRDGSEGTAILKSDVKCKCNCQVKKPYDAASSLCLSLCFSLLWFLPVCVKCLSSLFSVSPGNYLPVRQKQQTLLCCVQKRVIALFFSAPSTFPGKTNVKNASNKEGKREKRTSGIFRPSVRPS